MHNRLIRFISFSFPVAYAAFALATLGATGCHVDVYHDPPHDPHSDRLQHVVGGNYEIHPLSSQGLCLDVRGDKAAANQEVWLYACHGKENQRWAFVDKPNSSSNITGVGGLCLDVTGWQTAEGTPVNIHPCGADQANQTFRHFENGQIREVQSGKCLGVASVAEGQRLVIGSCVEGAPGQVWALTQ
jgi:hypothetical protein